MAWGSAFAASGSSWSAGKWMTSFKGSFMANSSAESTMYASASSSRSRSWNGEGSSELKSCWGRLSLISMASGGREASAKVSGMTLPYAAAPSLPRVNQRR
jgi:hypothetical protein